MTSVTEFSPTAVEASILILVAEDRPQPYRRDGLVVPVSLRRADGWRCHGALVVLSDDPVYDERSEFARAAAARSTASYDDVLGAIDALSRKVRLDDLSPVHIPNGDQPDASYIFAGEDEDEEWEEVPDDEDPTVSVPSRKGRVYKSEKLDAAMDFLRSILTCPRPVHEIDGAAKAQGITRKTWRTAKERIGVKAQRVAGIGAKGFWVAFLPEMSDALVQRLS